MLILHGTGGSGRSLLNERFRRRAVRQGSAARRRASYYVILPDGIGHGKSSKPSDGLRMRASRNTPTQDMVLAQHTCWSPRAARSNHLRLVMGTSMGCMHTFMWGETYPDFMDALMPLACLPVQIAGRNRLWRDLVMDAIRNDPQWHEGRLHDRAHAAPCARPPACC